MLIHAQLREATEDILRYRSSRVHDETRYTHCDAEYGGTCTYPSSPFSCPCRKDAITSRALKATRGANLAIVALPQLYNWIREWETHYVPTEHFQMELIVAHSKYKGKYPIDKAMKNLAGVRVENEPADAHERLIDEPENMYVYQGSRAAHKYFILSTPNSFEPHCGRKVCEKRTWTRTTTGKKPRQLEQTQSLPSLVVGLIVVDESHKFKSPSAEPWKLIERLKKRMNDLGIPKLLNLTGTPFITSFDNLSATLTALMDPEARKDVVNPRDLSTEDVVEYTSRFKEYTSAITKGKTVNQSDMNDIVQRLGSQLKALIMRRTKRSKWFDQPILTLPEFKNIPVNVRFPSEYREIYNETRDSFRLTLENELENAQVQWEAKSAKAKAGSTRPEKLRNSSVMSLSRQLLIAATMPWVLNFWAANGREERFLADSFKDWLYSNGRMRDECPLMECVKVARTFPKFEALDIILKIVFDAKEKLFIVSEWVCVAVVINEVRMQCLHDCS